MTEIPDGDFVRAIANIHHSSPNRIDMFAGRKVVIACDGELTEFDDDRLHTPSPLSVSTLTGVAAYLDAQIPQGDMEEEFTIVQVCSPSGVSVVAPLVGEYRQMFTYMNAYPMLPTVAYGTFIDLEYMMIQLQTMFAPTPDRDVLIKFLGSVKVENSVHMADDGVGQTVTAKTGVIKTEEVQVNNPWVLAPYRTFPEIDQPISPFVLRMDKSGRTALIEADGGAWRVEAITRIATWLREAGVTLPIIA